VVGRVDTYTFTRIVPANGEIVIHARNATDPPRGLLVNSDVPVVSSPTT
jgi:hypothetical protein